MKAVAILIVVLGIFSASSANTDVLVEAGKALVNAAVEQGKKLLIDAASDLLSKLGGLGIIGKREVNTLQDAVNELKVKFGDLLKHGHKVAGMLFKDKMDKLKSLTNWFHQRIGLVKDAKEVTDKVDEVVDDHETKHKRIISDLVQKGKDLLGATVDKVKKVLSGVKAKASELVSNILQKGANVLIGKRATLSDHLQTIGGALGSALSPFKDIVSGVGTTLKGHFSNLVDTLKGHVTALKGKLSGHVDDLKDHGSKLLEHGKNALGALSEVVQDVLKQTLENAKPHIEGAAKTIVNAGNTALNHITGKDSGAPAVVDSY